MSEDPNPLSSAEVQSIPFCDQWAAENYDAKDAATQETYIADELRRLQAEGAPILRAVLACGEEWVIFVALKLIYAGVDSQGVPVVDLPMVYLRLVAPDALVYEHPETREVQTGVATPPSRDPQGRLLPRDKIGKVLVAKLGNLGGNLDPKLDAKAAMQFSGPRRDAAVRAGKPIYITKEITREPKAFTVREAVVVLKQWGFGIGETAFRSIRSADHKGERARGQCTWLVEELAPEAAQAAMLRGQVERAKAAKSTPVASGAK
jgi:hypothetical protein